MKTEKKFLTVSNLKLLMVLPLLAAVMVTFSSCNQNKSSDTTFNEIAPPPPPPPPAAPVSDSVYTVVDELPLFTDGDAGLLKYIGDSTVYPQDAKMNNITGRVIVSFVVNKDCTVSNVKVLKGVSPSIDAEAVRVVTSLPKFKTPGIKGGVPVSVNYMVPITFTLK